MAPFLIGLSVTLLPMLAAVIALLTEGVDVPAIDLVAFLDPKNSYVDIVQAIGRALRKADGKKVGTILLAVYISDGENAENVIASTRFAGIRAVLEVLRDEDPDFAAALASAGPRPAGAVPPRPTADPATSGPTPTETPGWATTPVSAATAGTTRRRSCEPRPPRTPPSRTATRPASNTACPSASARTSTGRCALSCSPHPPTGRRSGSASDCRSHRLHRRPRHPAHRGLRSPAGLLAQ